MRRSPGFPSLSLFLVLLGTLFCFPEKTFAQQILTPFEQLAVAALFGGKPLKSLTLSGSATWIAGSLKENGTVSLTAGPDGSVSEAWTLPTQSHGVAETSFAAGKSCSYTDQAGNQHPNAVASCVQPIAWFAPWVALNLLPSGNLLSVTDITQPSDTAVGAVKLRFVTVLNGASDATTQAQLADLSNRTAVTVLFDLKSALPSSLTFEYVLDNDPKHVIEYTTVFADYRSEQGFVVPHHIQRYIQRTLQADILITSVSAN